MEDSDFPTAIVPTRPTSLEEKYDQYAEQFGDPLLTLFTIQASSIWEENRIRAASELLPYRYPRLRAQEFSVNAPNGTVNVQINLGAPPPTQRTIPAHASTPPDPLS